MSLLIKKNADKLEVLNCHPSSIISIESSIDGYRTKTFVEQLMKNEPSPILLLQTERPEICPKFEGKNVTSIDLFKNNKKDCQVMYSVANIHKVIMKNVDQTTDQKVVIITSFTPIMLHNSLSNIIKLVSSLASTKKIKTLLYSCITHCHKQDNLDMIRDLVQTALVMEPTVSGMVSCALRHRRALGKSVCVRQTIQIDNNSGEIKHVPTNDETKLDSQINKDNDSEDAKMNALTTFNLTLNDNEKAARDKVAMPFWKDEQKVKPKSDDNEEEAVRINPSTSNVAKIYYEPDEADDWDDEDPDDDLDF